MGKRILKSILSVSFCTGFLMLGSCTAGFEDLNAPGEKITDGELNRDNFKLQSYFEQMIDNVISQQENSFQMNENLIGDVYGRYLMTTQSNWNMQDFSTYNAPSNWIKYPFNDVLQKFTSPWFQVKEATNETGAVWAWATILRVAAMHRLGDMYGALPYSQVNSEDIATPYDDLQTLYHKMIDDLTNAVDVITSSLSSSTDAILPDADVVYKGDMTKWVKFANSLKLRLAMRLRMVESESAYAQQNAEDAVNHSIGVITSNADNTAHPYGQPGLWKMCVNWGDSRAAADIVSYMVGYNDPRLSLYFSPVTFTGNDGVYAGFRSGGQPSNKEWAVQYSCPVATQSDVYYWITAAEVAFLKAEGALYGWNMGGKDAETLYKEGISLSFEQHGANGAATYAENETDKPADYTDPGKLYNATAVSDITIKWENGNTERNFERIITQKWIAMFPLGQEAWTEYRRTGYPKFFTLPVPTNYSTLTTVANRIPFNPDEYNNNEANVRAAVQALGGKDDYSVALYWAKK